MSISVTRHNGGIVIPKNVVPLNLMEHAKKLDLSDEDLAKRAEILTALNGLTQAEKAEPFRYARKADNHPDNLWGIIELQNQTVKIYKNGGVEAQGGINIDWDNIDGAQNRADAILSKYGGQFEKVAHQQEIEFIPQGPTKFQNLLHALMVETSGREIKSGDPSALWW